MKRKLLISVAGAALIGVSGLAFAQSPGGGSAQGGATNAPASSGAASQNAPAAAQAPAGRAEGTAGQAAPGAHDAAPREGKEQRAQDGKPADMKSKATASENDRKAGKAKSSDRATSDDGMKANPKNAASESKSDARPNANAKPGSTTGQAAAGGKQLTGEQRTTIRTSITKLNVRPTTNVNFSISVGARVPRGVAFHSLPPDVISFYPDWRGYEFILVGDQIVVVNPRTLQIVAVLEA